LSENSQGQLIVCETPFIFRDVMKPFLVVNNMLVCNTDMLTVGSCLSDLNLDFEELDRLINGYLGNLNLEIEYEWS
jgi:hypothetical protein